MRILAVIATRVGLSALALATTIAWAQPAPAADRSASAAAPPTAAGPAPAVPPPAHDAELARSLGADERGMRRYVLAILKTGPTPVPAGPERDAMFRGHFANMERMAAAGTLVVAGPLDGVDGRRGLYVFAVPDIDAARALVAGDPVIQRGEMVAEYHAWYGSAALMAVPATHARIARRKPS